MSPAPASRTFQDAASRWAGVGPYYAMFPVAFADSIVREYTEPGDTVLDPFAGRGTAVFSAAAQDRSAVGVEINPVGYVYARAKLRPARRSQVEGRLDDLGELANGFEAEAEELPWFFHRCFSPGVRRFLLAARSELDWRRGRIDRTLMALLLVYLHGKEGAALSNQMRQTKSMSPQYAVRWWDERSLDPPEIDPVAFIKSRLDWRYAKGVPDLTDGKVYLGDSKSVLRRLSRRIAAKKAQRARLLFTSPPYYAVTNYHYDQWLRLWLLGGPPNALRTGGARRGKFEHREDYRLLLLDVFKRAAQVLTPDATVYVRTDHRQFTHDTTVSVLEEVFPDKLLERTARPFARPTQTSLFGDTSTKKGEVDLVLRPA